jgi:ribonuclease HI
VPHPILEVRLYFDGGARGNPGIAGGGSLLLERSDPLSDWNLVWWKASYFGNDNTNNYAEHAALATGVRECVDRYPHQRIRLHVIGDSRLVLQQVIGAAQTKQRTLRRASEPTAQALSLFQHLTLSHTLRAGNTMADHLANCAMNDQLSSSSSTAWTPVDTHLVTRLQSDTSHALTPITCRPASDILTELASTIARQRLKPPD